MHKFSTSDRNHLSRWTVGTYFVCTSGNEGFRSSTCRFLLPVPSLTSTTNCTLSRGKLDLYIHVSWTQSPWLLASLHCCMQNRKQTLVKASNNFSRKHKASPEVCTYLQHGGHADCLESPVVLGVHSEVPLWVLKQFIPAGSAPECLHWSAQTSPEAGCSMAILSLASSSSHYDATRNLCS